MRLVDEQALCVCFIVPSYLRLTNEHCSTMIIFYHQTCIINRMIIANMNQITLHQLRIIHNFLNLARGVNRYFEKFLIFFIMEHHSYECNVKKIASYDCVSVNPFRLLFNVNKERSAMTEWCQRFCGFFFQRAGGVSPPLGCRKCVGFPSGG